jgi:hypothetical protein
MQRRELKRSRSPRIGRVSGLDAAAFAEAAAAARLQVLRSAGARQDLPGELRAKLEPST